MRFAVAYPALLSLACLAFLVSSPARTQQADHSRQAFSIFVQKCGCHEPGGRTVRVLNLASSATIGRDVVPGQPNSSEIYRRISTFPGGQGIMPPSGQPLSPAEIDTIRKWIAEGAKDPSAVPPPVEVRFVPHSGLDTIVDNDLKSLPSEDRKSARYFSLTEVANSGEKPPVITVYKTALAATLGLLSHGKTVHLQALDEEPNVMRIDMRELGWDADTWNVVLGAYPYGVVANTPVARHEALISGTSVPVIRADWLVTRAIVSPLYNTITKTAASTKMERSTVDQDPVVTVAKLFDAPLDPKHAAAEAGVGLPALRAAIPSQPNGEGADLKPLLEAKGMVTREAWEKAFAKLADSLGLGTVAAPKS